jgi:hypothetical protein
MSVTTAEKNYTNENQVSCINNNILFNKGNSFILLLHTTYNTYHYCIYSTYAYCIQYFYLHSYLFLHQALKEYDVPYVLLLKIIII